MTAPVDLANLRSMTDGDSGMEKALFEEFYSSFEAGLAAMQANITEATAEVWRKNAHALKGIALNLGADELGELCKQAQDGAQGTESAKVALLGQITIVYKQVKQFLQEIT